MRLIGSLKNKVQAEGFSLFLVKQGILNQCEIHINTDWGSPEYGDVSCNIWIYEEENVDRAEKLLEEFQNDPNDSRFHVDAVSSNDSPLEPEIEIVQETGKTTTGSTTKKISWENQPIGLMTLYLLITCAWLFMWGATTAPAQIESIPTNIPLVPLTESPINKKLVYDYPRTYEIIDRIVLLYGIEKATNPAELPPEGRFLFEEYLHTPYWEGFYNYLLIKLITAKENDQWNFRTPLFEKIREGEVWRLFTPCLLHANFLHILFNMLWLVVLGKQVESRLGKMKYLFFIILTGVISNTAQYLMSGANFIGISGVLCALFSFIWIRQRYAAWEGYQIQQGTVAFMAFFIITMFSIQLISFFLELYLHMTISPGIANTAHLSGVLMGLLLGRMRFFSWSG